MGKRILVLATIIVLGFSCQKSLEQERKELMIADSLFSVLSKRAGMNAAFKAYLAEDAVALRPSSSPIVGKAKIVERLLSLPDTTFSLTWKPHFAAVAASRDLGYTYGIYTFLSKDEFGNPQEAHGTYVSIWKKDQHGEWKLVLDSGNSGIEE